MKCKAYDLFSCFIKQKRIKMQVVYLKDGRKCKLISKTEAGYIVDPFAVYFTRTFDEPQSGDDEEFEMLSNKLEQVDKVYDRVPMDVIDAEYLSVREMVDAKKLELVKLMDQVTAANRDLNQAKNQKTDISRYIVNREELKSAKRLIAWPKDKIAPRIMGGIKGQKFTVTYTIDQWGASEERCWLYEAYTEQRHNESGYYTYSEYYDMEYGIKADLTDEEILAITNERQRKKKFDNYAIKATSDQWLTPENIEKKKEFAQLEKKSALDKAEQEFIVASNRLNELKGEQVVS